MPAIVGSLLRIYYGFLLIGGVGWVLNIPARLSIPVIETEWLALYLAIAVAAAHLKFPYGKSSGPIEILIGIISFACWIWAAFNLENWIFDLEGNTPQKYLPAIFAIVAMMEAMRKTCGNSITVLVWILIAYGLFGHHMPQPLQANYSDPRSLIMYLYTDTNAVLGIVLAIDSTLVLAFMVFGRLMEVSGATGFFTDFAMSIVGHKRGGPAKVAVVASSLFGSVSSSPVGNIMSTGVVTIPLMKKIGFKAHQAAAIEA
ncbi:MAG: TRAP transporter large permease subunit, partial [Rhizobiaceae bacterium]|nr:TRAP transporter large permease subunit [Rhizobiaceae bacterium]